jgi:hypothetical protein
MIDSNLIDVLKPENIVTVRRPNTAAGSGYSVYQLGTDQFCPAGYFYQLISATFVVTTSANVGTRTPYLATSGGGQNIYWRIRDETGVVASRVVRYTVSFPMYLGGIATGGFSSSTSTAGVTNIRTTGLPLLILTAPDDLVIDVSAVLAGDFVSNIAFRFLRSTRRGFGGDARRFE